MGTNSEGCSSISALHYECGRACITPSDDIEVPRQAASDFWHHHGISPACITILVEPSILDQKGRPSENGGKVDEWRYKRVKGVQVEARYKVGDEQRGCKKTSSRF